MIFFSRPSSMHVLTDMQMNQTSAYRDIKRFGFGFGQGSVLLFYHVISQDIEFFFGTAQQQRWTGKEEFLCQGLTTIFTMISMQFLFERTISEVAVSLPLRPRAVCCCFQFLSTVFSLFLVFFVVVVSCFSFITDCHKVN